MLALTRRRGERIVLDGRYLLEVRSIFRSGQGGDGDPSVKLRYSTLGEDPILSFWQKEGQRFGCGGDITIGVDNISGGQVKFYIEADKKIEIDREEIYLRKQQECAGGYE